MERNRQLQRTIHLLLREISGNRPDELHSIGVSYCFLILSLGAKRQLSGLERWIQRGLAHACFSVLVAEGRGPKNKRFLSNRLDPMKWKNDNLFPFRLWEKMLLMIWGCNVQKNLTPVSEGQKTKSMIWCNVSQKMVTPVFEYSDEVGKGKRGAKSMGILYNMWYVKSQSHFISILPFHILPSWTFRHGSNFGLMRSPDSEKLSSHMISDHRCNLSRVETLGNFIKKNPNQQINT